MNTAATRTIKPLILTCTVLLGACSSDSNTRVTADTSTLIENAIIHSSSNIGVNLNSMSAIANGSTITSTLTRMAKSAPKITSSASQYNNEVEDYLRPTLEGGNATLNRDGNTITIDPDERYICQQWFDNQQQDSNSTDCAEILTDLAVRIIATTDDTGTLSYLYGGEDLLAIQYAPASGGYELFLPGAKALAQRSAEVTDNNVFLPETVEGAIKLTTDVHNATEGEEAGSISAAITQAIHVRSEVNNFDFELGRSTLFDIQSNAATGDGSISIAINALKLAVGDLLGSNDFSVTTIDLPDFTLAADIQKAGTEVLLTDVGLGRGPFTIAIDNNEVLNVEIAKFSAHYNDLTREAEFLTAFDMSVLYSHSKAAFGWIGDDSSLHIFASTPAGTLFSEQLNGSTKVERGGPFSLKSSYANGSSADENFEQDVLFTSGQCFDDSSFDDGFELVSCD